MRDNRTPVLGEATPATIPDLVLANAVNRSADPAVTWMSGGTVSTMSWSMYRDRIINVALAFLQLDVGPGRDVAVLTGNNVEHLIASMAAAHCGAAAVSIYETLSDEQLAHVLDDCRPTVLIVADDEAARRARRLANCRDCVGAIVTLDGSGALGWPELGLLGTRVTAEWITALEERMAHLDRSDPLTYVYTSGTTGASKGVILTTDNLLDEVASVTRSGLLDREYCSISYLPMAHVVERLWSLYVPAYLGGHVVCCPDAADLPAYLARFRPSIFFGVPRVFEKLARLAEATMAVQFSDVGPTLESERTLLTRISRQRRDGGSIPAELASAEAIAREGEVRRVRTRLGLDRAIVGCGAAAMSEDLHDLWASLGIDVLLGYGLTETAGIAVSDRPGLGASGAVGLPMPGWEARIAEDGEILLRGPGNTTGYRNRPDATDELYAPQGWLRTGDLGALDNAGRLHVTGRKKDILVTAAGKNITPTVIESRLSGQSFLDHAMVLAEGRPYVVALLTVDPEALRQFATGHHIATENLGELVQHPVVLARVDELVAGANARLSRPEQIKKYTVLSETWTPQTGQLTATMKLRRNVIERAYHDLVAALYGDPPHRQGSEQ